MKRTLLALLVLALLLGLLPVGASAVSLSSADKKDLDDLLSYYEWYGIDYNCTDAAAFHKDAWRPNLLSAVVIHPACVRNSRYPVTVQENWMKADPRGRWSSHSRISVADAHWLLTNIFHCSGEAIDKMRADLANSEQMYEQGGYYYAALYGVGDGFYTKNIRAYEYGKLYLLSFQMYSDPDEYLLGSKYAVVGKVTADGMSFWSLYYYGDTRPSDTGFLDVDDGAYYAPSVEWALDKGITAGVSDYSFAPNSRCTRAQAVTFLWRAAGKQEPKTRKNPFSDVAAGVYYEKPVLWAVENGITNGTGEGRFSPDSPCTRAQIVTFLHRAAGSPAPKNTDSFSDVAPGSYYELPVRWAVEKGITTGTGNGKFSPDSYCTRAQMVTFLQRFLDKSSIQPKPLPNGWLGNWVADSGERIEVSAVTAQNVTLTHWVLTASGESMVHNTFTLEFIDPARTVVTRPYMTSVPELQYVYTLDEKAKTITLSTSFDGRVQVFQRQG